MSWGIVVNNVEILRVTKDGIPHRIEELEADIIRAQNQLIALSAYTLPVYEDGPDKWPLPEYVAMKVPEIVQELTDAHTELYILRIAKDDIENVTQF